MIFVENVPARIADYARECHAVADRLDVLSARQASEHLHQLGRMLERLSVEAAQQEKNRRAM